MIVPAIVSTIRESVADNKLFFVGALYTLRPTVRTRICCIGFVVGNDYWERVNKSLQARSEYRPSRYSSAFVVHRRRKCLTYTNTRVRVPVNRTTRPRLLLLYNVYNVMRYVDNSTWWTQCRDWVHTEPAWVRR